MCIMECINRLNQALLATGSSELKKSFRDISDSSLKTDSMRTGNQRHQQNLGFESKTEGGILPLCKTLPYPDLELAAPDYAPVVQCCVAKNSMDKRQLK